MQAVHQRGRQGLTRPPDPARSDRQKRLAYDSMDSVGDVIPTEGDVAEGGFFDVLRPLFELNARWSIAPKVVKNPPASAVRPGNVHSRVAVRCGSLDGLGSVRAPASPPASAQQALEAWWFTSRGLRMCSHVRDSLEADEVRAAPRVLSGSLGRTRMVPATCGRVTSARQGGDKGQSRASQGILFIIRTGIIMLIIALLIMLIIAIIALVIECLMLCFWSGLESGEVWI